MARQITAPPQKAVNYYCKIYNSLKTVLFSRKYYSSRDNIYLAVPSGFEAEFSIRPTCWAFWAVWGHSTSFLWEKKSCAHQVFKHPLGYALLQCGWVLEESAQPRYLRVPHLPLRHCHDLGQQKVTCWVGHRGSNLTYTVLMLSSRKLWGHSRI